MSRSGGLPSAAFATLSAGSGHRARFGKIQTLRAYGLQSHETEWKLMTRRGSTLR